MAIGMTFRTRVIVLALVLTISLAVGLAGSTSSRIDEVPVVSGLAANDAQAAGPPAVVIVWGTRYVVSRAWPWAYRVCARYCLWVPRAWNVYDAINKARYVWCTIQRRPNCHL